MAVTERDLNQGTFAKRRLTPEALVALPDDGHKYELVDGAAKVAPTWWKHGPIAIRFIKYFLLADAEKHGALADSSTGFRMKSGNVRSPDVSYVQQERVPTGADADKFFDGAPDLAVEIVSDSEDREDMARKVVEYLDSGAQLVWQVFPNTSRIVVHHSVDRVCTFEADDELTCGELIPGFRVRVHELLPPE